MANKGIVYLVGAGPGDPKLITIRGMEALKKSDVVVYDRLASPRLLQLLQKGTEVIYVGKRTDRHTMQQEQINELLVNLALQGKSVTRLKGGDPTVFGRVGEEAELLVQNGIQFEIIPGVTSATAVPAYAGIPVTHRDYASSFAIITGHEYPGKLDMNIKWEKLANAVDTMVFLMGVAKIDYICDQLIQHGKPSETPVALIRWGTRAKQQTLVGTLADITLKVKQANFKPPGIILVGEVVKLRETLNWYEKKPLFGRRVLVTRARSQASELAERIDELGGEPYEFPVIELRQPTDDSLHKLDQALMSIEKFDWIIFTSTNGVEFFFLRMKQLGIDIRSMAKARIAAVGPKTEEALLNRGLLTSVVPASFYQAEGLLASVLPELMQGQEVLLPRADLARDYLTVQLTELGLHVTDVDVYNNVICSDGIEELIEMFNDREIHIITFTSSSTVNNLCRLVEEHTGHKVADLFMGVKIACIGPVTAATISSWGLSIDYMAQESTIDSLVEAIIHNKS